MRRRVVLALAHLVVDVRRLVGAVLGDDHRRADEQPVASVLEHEEVLALEGVLHLAREALHRLVDDRLERLLVVGQVDGVEHGGQALEAR